MTKPVEGGKVTFFPHAETPIPALITKVWGDTCVNVEYAVGDEIKSPTSVFLWSEGLPKPEQYYCVLVDEQDQLTSDGSTLESLVADGLISTETVEALNLEIKQPPTDDDHVAPGHSLFSDPTKFKALTRLEQAQALQEVAGDLPHFQSDDPEHICAFKGLDGRTMRVVETPAGLAAQQA